VTVPITRTVTEAPAGPLVPNVVGSSEDDARATLGGAGYQFEQQGDNGGGFLGLFDSTSYKVVAQSPPAGTPLPRGAPVLVSLEAS
jgi:beta-lactam-binding protein with PASTA domain